MNEERVGIGNYYRSCLFSKIVGTFKEEEKEISVLSLFCILGAIYINFICTD